MQALPCCATGKQKVNAIKKVNSIHAAGKCDAWTAKRA
jgi:hypothetical protein